VWVTLGVTNGHVYTAKVMCVRECVKLEAERQVEIYKRDPDIGGEKDIFV
jgi:hypothetical protein